jgi:hypothetical protein
MVRVEVASGAPNTSTQLRPRGLVALFVTITGLANVSRGIAVGAVALLTVTKAAARAWFRSFARARRRDGSRSWRYPALSRRLSASCPLGHFPDIKVAVVAA